MKPTLIKKCLYRPNQANDYEVLLRIDPLDPCKKFPEYALVYEDDNYWIGIKEFFPSDGGTVPRIVWTLTGLTPFDLRCVYGFYIHDGIYSSHLLSQLQGDVILDNILNIAPSPNWCQRQIVYRTLRAVGHHAYDGKSDIEIKWARDYVTVIEKKKLASTVIKL